VNVSRSIHIYEVRPRKDKRSFDLISDVLPFGRLWYTKVRHAVDYAKFYSRLHDVVIRVYDDAGNAMTLIPCWCHTTFVRSRWSGRPRETKGVTVTVPLLTGCEIRALKRPEASSV
jgi:hypothetical protein